MDDQLPLESVAQTDDTLAARAAKGDTQAFGLVYDRYAVRVASLLRSYADDELHLQDLVHDTFCRVMDGLPAYRPRGKFRSWLFTIALNVGRKDARKRAKLVSIGSTEAPVAPPEQNADFATHSHERGRLAQAMLRSLPEHERLVVVLRIWLELSYDEIASLLGVPSGTARRRMHTALKGLRSSFGETHEAGGNDISREASHGRPTAVGG